MSAVRDYHARTRWTPDRPPAAEPLDPATEPAAFRRYKGAELLPLASPEDPGPAWGDLFRSGAVAPRPLDRGFVSRLFCESLAISAWKEEGPLRFSLRVSPSAGNLHPVEAYLLAGPIPGLHPRPALYHYSPFDHGLEVRRELPEGLGKGIFVGLTAILWRTAWKYGERAFRLVHLDAGHALAAVAVAAAARGWKARLVEVADRELAWWLGVAEQSGLTAERPVGLLALEPAGGGGVALPPEMGSSPLVGQPTRVSRGCREMPGLEEVAGATIFRTPTARHQCCRSICPSASVVGAQFIAPATVRPASTVGSPGRSVSRTVQFSVRTDAGAMNRAPTTDAESSSQEPALEAARGSTVEAIVRGRRSRPGFAEVPLPAAPFRRFLDRLSAAGDHPTWPLPARPSLRLAFFIHHVEGCRPGLYGLESGTLRLLLPGDLRALAERIACGQTAAGHAAFVAVFLADLTPAYAPATAWLYKGLHWEAGALSHLLYLEAEAAGLGATGLAGFYDGAVPDLLGDWGRGLEALYLTAVGVRRQA